MLPQVCQSKLDDIKLSLSCMTMERFWEVDRFISTLVQVLLLKEGTTFQIPNFKEPNKRIYSNFCFEKSWNEPKWQIGTFLNDLAKFDFDNLVTHLMH